MPEPPNPPPAFTRRLLKGLLPIAPVLAIGWASGIAKPHNPLIDFAALILCALCLALGWRWIKATLLTKWIGLCLAAWAILNLALLGFGTSVSPLPFLFLLVPLALYDLFIRQPWKGRFARARAERRGEPE